MPFKIVERKAAYHVIGSGAARVCRLNQVDQQLQHSCAPRAIPRTGGPLVVPGSRVRWACPPAKTRAVAASVVDRVIEPDVGLFELSFAPLEALVPQATQFTTVTLPVRLHLLHAEGLADMRVADRLALPDVVYRVRVWPRRDGGPSRPVEKGHPPGLDSDPRRVLRHAHDFIERVVENQGRRVHPDWTADRFAPVRDPNPTPWLMTIITSFDSLPAQYVCSRVRT
mmetsp:Transcript_93759/g.268324  ORF Transcript_93759/g.268324 Transcript_93759/m.268324 type:complete len:226 (-) Transcript_93759:71-748(-)